MRKDAEAHAEEDRKRKDLIEARNNADNTVYAAEKALREFGDKVPAEIKARSRRSRRGEESCGERRRCREDQISHEALGQAIQKIGASVYEQNQPSGGGEAGPSSRDAGPDVVDGEVKE
jgi:molecular chaperone DnaK